MIIRPGPVARQPVSAVRLGRLCVGQLGSKGHVLEIWGQRGLAGSCCVAPEVTGTGVGAFPPDLSVGDPLRAGFLAWPLVPHPGAEFPKKPHLRKSQNCQVLGQNWP